MALAEKKISHLTFCSEYKTIRTEKGLHFHEHTLMRHSISKRRVIVKSHECESLNELSGILNDYSRLIDLHSTTKFLCNFVGYCIQEGKQSVNKRKIYFIYDYHQSTLEEQVNSMMLKGEKLDQREIDCLSICLSKGLGALYSQGFNFLNLKYSNILVQDRNTLGLKFKLLFTPYLQGSISEIKSYHSHIEDYNLAQPQLKLLQSVNSRDEQSLSILDKCKVDKQSLGLLLLRIATINQSKSSFYTVNERNQIIWNLDELKNRISIINKCYSRDFTTKVQKLLLDNNYGIKSCYESSPWASQKNLTASRKEQKSSKSGSKDRDSQWTNGSGNKKTKNLKQNIGNGETENKHKLVIQTRPFDQSRFSLTKYERMKADIELKIYPKIQQQKNRQKVKNEDGVEYIGGIRNGKKQGFGICYFAEGDIYAGQWKDDMFEDEGEYLFQNCDLYSGHTKKSLKNGRGKYIYNNGNFYQGQWVDDLKHGYGIFVNNQKGEKYQGNWYKGTKDGIGMFNWKNGDSFDGKFQAGLRWGKGTLTKANGTKIQANWTNDELFENATVNFSSGTVTSSQLMPVGKNLILNGQAEQTTSDGTFFKGKFTQNKRNGICTINYSNGDVYEGNMKDDKFEGEGKYYYKNMECIYAGEWKNGTQNGKGVLQFANKTKIQCEWMDGKHSTNGKIYYENGDYYQGQIGRMGRNGYGAYYRKSGDKIEGQFKNGVLV